MSSVLKKADKLNLSLSLSLMQENEIQNVVYKLLLFCLGLNILKLYSVRRPIGVCRWPLKIWPKKIKGKMEFGAKKFELCKDW